MNVISMLAMLGPVLVAIYTWNYARWARKQGLHRGAVGLVLLALATVLIPSGLLLWPH